MIPAIPLSAIWAWLARFAAPLAGAFMAGYLLAMLNSEEAKLREEIAAIKAVDAFQTGLVEKAEARRIESEAKLIALESDYQKALANAKRADPSLARALSIRLPRSLLLDSEAGPDSAAE